MSRAVSGAGIALGVVAACGCGSMPPRADADGVSFELIAEAQRETAEHGTVFRMADPELSVAVQRVPVTDGLAHGRTVERVADGLVRRVSYGEVDGAMAHRPCRAGGERAVCLDGFIVRHGATADVTYVRRGVLVESHGEIVLIEAIGERSTIRSLEHQRDLVRRTLRLGGTT